MTRRAVVFARVIFAGAVAGDLLQWLLPPHHLSDAKGVITAVQALITALLALVLLVWTAYGVYTQQYSEMMTLAGYVLALDIVLDRMGPDGLRGRALLWEQLTDMRKRFWGHDGDCGPPLPYARAREALSRSDGFYRALKPASGGGDASAVDEARALSTSVITTILLMGRQLRNPEPHALIHSVVHWAVLIFCCLGATATLNALAVVFQALGALSVASAIFLIIDFSEPYSGWFRIVPAGMDERIDELGRRLTA